MLLSSSTNLSLVSFSPLPGSSQPDRLTRYWDIYLISTSCRLSDFIPQTRLEFYECISHSWTWTMLLYLSGSKEEGNLIFPDIIQFLSKFVCFSDSQHQHRVKFLTKLSCHFTIICFWLLPFTGSLIKPWRLSVSSPHWLAVSQWHCGNIQLQQFI